MVDCGRDHENTYTIMGRKADAIPDVYGNGHSLRLQG